MKLWRVEVVIPVVVVADDYYKAKSVADYNIDMIMECEDAHGFTYVSYKEQIVDAKSLPPGWTIEVCPYGCDGENTIEWYLDSIEHKDTATIDMFESKE